MHALQKRTYPIYINAFTYTPPQTHIYILTHTNKVTHSQANKQLCTITNTDTPTHTC